VRKAFRWLIILAVTGVLVAALAIGIAYLTVASDLPDVDSLRDARLQVPLRVYTSDRKLMGLFGEKRRIPYPIDAIPERVKVAGQVFRLCAARGLALFHARLKFKHAANNILGGKFAGLI